MKGVEQDYKYYNSLLEELISILDENIKLKMCPNKQNEELNQIVSEVEQMKVAYTHTIDVNSFSND